MIKVDKFYNSRTNYAFKPDAFVLKEQIRSDGSSFWRGTVKAVWFNRKGAACIGFLWDYQSKKPEDVYAFIRAHTDGRYGGDTRGRWNGRGFWGNVTLAEQQEYLAVLKPMYRDKPNVPLGYEGWYRF